MSARLFDHEFEVSVALFARAYEGYGVRDTEQFAVQDGAAFVNDEFHLHALCFEVADDVRRAAGGIAGFLVVSEAEIEVAVELFAVGEMIFHRFEERDHVAFHILRAAPVDVAVIREHALERIVFPAVFGGGDDVDVAEIASAFECGVAAFEMIDDGVSRDDLAFCGGVEEGIGLRQPIAVVDERLDVVGVIFHHRDGGDAYRLSQVPYGGVLVYGGEILRFPRGDFGTIERRADDERGKEDDYDAGNYAADDRAYGFGCHKYILLIRREIKLYKNYTLNLAVFQEGGEFRLPHIPCGARNGKTGISAAERRQGRGKSPRRASGRRREEKAKGAGFRRRSNAAKNPLF